MKAVLIAATRGTALALARVLLTGLIWADDARISQPPMEPLWTVPAAGNFEAVPSLTWMDPSISALGQRTLAQHKPLTAARFLQHAVVGTRFDGNTAWGSASSVASGKNALSRPLHPQEMIGALAASEPLASARSSPDNGRSQLSPINPISSPLAITRLCPKKGTVPFSRGALIAYPACRGTVPFFGQSRNH